MHVRPSERRGLAIDNALTTAAVVAIILSPAIILLGTIIAVMNQSPLIGFASLGLAFLVAPGIAAITGAAIAWRKSAPARIAN